MDSYRAERIANLVFGLNLWAWAILTLVTVPGDQRWTVVRLCIAALHATGGTLFLIRQRLVKGGSLTQLMYAVPAIVLSGLAFSHAPASNSWPWYADALFLIGTLIAIVSFCFLARHFAVLPAVRGVTVSGPYRLVRHPAYLGEMILVLGCVTASPDWQAALIFLVTLAAVVVRILIEESLFAKSMENHRDAYADYRTKVRYRLFPRIW